ncbi:AarF/UbiB family protein [Methylophilaceae bacterium]|nr:AarF/UbiB family protein [Methylophilaceae bacterium]
MVDIVNLKILKVLREIPGKRRVVDAKIDGVSYIVKFFNNKGEYLKDLHGVFHLKNTGILTPRVFSFGILSNQYYIIFQKINDATNVDQLLISNESLKSKQAVIKKVLALNKKMYENNVIQKDNYFKNYLYQNGKVYLIDGGLVKKIKFFKTIRKFLNFSLISSKINPEFLLKKATSYKYNFIEFLHKKCVDLYLYKEISNFQKKTLRNSSQFEKKASLNCLILKQRNFHFEFNNIDNFLMNAEIIKNGNTCTVFRFDDLIIKRYNIKSIWHFIKIQFIKSRGKNSWQISNTFQLHNLPCPKPFFYFEKRFLFFKFTSYFAMERIDGVGIVSYQESLKNKLQIEKLKKNIFKLFNKLIHYKFIHGDFKETNILVDKKMQLIMIDFDKSFFSLSQSIYNSRFKRQIIRFLSNWNNKSKFLKTIRSLEKLI